MLCDCICMLCIYLFPPLSSLVDLETDVASEYDYVADVQPLVAELPGKQTPLIISISPISFSPVLALEFATIIQKLLF